MYHASKFLMATVMISCSLATSAQAAHEGKAWKHDNAKMFDLFLRTNSIVVYRVHKSMKTIHETNTALKSAHEIKATPAQEAEFVQAQLNKSLELVKPFMNDIRGYKDLIMPLLNESAINHHFKSKHLETFLKGNQDLETYTKSSVKTVASLEVLLQEIQGFFADLFASLSKETKDSYQAFVAKQQKSQKK